MVALIVYCASSEKGKEKFGSVRRFVSLGQ